MGSVSIVKSERRKRDEEGKEVPARETVNVHVRGRQGEREAPDRHTRTHTEHKHIHTHADRTRTAAVNKRRRWGNMGHERQKNTVPGYTRELHTFSPREETVWQRVWERVRGARKQWPDLALEETRR